MKTVLAVFTLLILASCSFNEGKPVDAQKANIKDDFEVTLLFEQDGVKVYRFRDNGYSRYFTTGPGKFAPQVQRHTTTTTNGKTTTITTHLFDDGANQ